MGDDDRTRITGHDAVPVQTLGGFTLEKVIGQGGMGRVYRATDPDGNIVAVKEMAAPRESKEFVRRFLREAEIRIDHPNIVRVIRAGEDDGRLYIAFELLEGSTLAERVRERGALADAEAVDLGAQMCEGLAAAHAQGIVHRDLKPSNVFVCNDGLVKLLDFGIAHVNTEGTQLTMDGSVLGTPGYLSPEQARGERVASERTDIWGVGAVLYMALSTRAPFARENPMAGMLAVVLDEPAPLDELGESDTVASISEEPGAISFPEMGEIVPPSISPQLWGVIARCLEKKPEDRFGSAGAVRDALRGADLEAAAEPGSDAIRAMPSTESRLVTVLLAQGVSDEPFLRKTVHQLGGLYTSLRGSHSIGLFGAESTEGDEVLRAVEVGFRARGAAQRMAVAGGRASRSGESVSGEAIAAAERACAFAAGDVAVDETAARLLRDRFEVTPLAEGFFEVHPPAGATWKEPTLADPPTFLDPASVSADSPILGREAEEVVLRVGRDTVVDEGRSWVGLVIGPIGVGKSRLRLATERALEEQGFELLVGRGESHRRGVAFGLWMTLLWHHFAGDTLATRMRDHIADSALALEYIETFEVLLGRDASADRHTGADPQVMADRVRVAIVEYLASLAERGPVALLTGDLQWADDASLSLLEDVLDELEDLPVFALSTCRPELLDRRPDLFSGRELHRLELKGLRPGEVGQLAGFIAGEPLRKELVTAIADRTGGNPFYVEQIVHELLDTGRLDDDIAELPIPVTIEAAVQSRLDHLPAREKDLCKRAAIYGRSFTAAGLMALGEADPARVLSSLQRRGVVSRARGRGKGKAHQFRSALLAEVAYAMNSDERKVELHRRVADFLAEWPGSDSSEVAHHYDQGDRPREASEHYMLATHDAAGRGDTNTILRCTERALALGVPNESRFALHMLRADAQAFLGKRGEQGEELAAALYAANGKLERARVLCEQSERLSAIGDREQGRVAAEEAVAAASGGDDADVLVQAHVRAAAALIYSGGLDDAQAHLEEAKRLVADATPQTAALTAAWRAQLATARGDFGECRAAYHDVIVGYTATGDRRRLAGAEVNLADTFNRVGAYREAEESLRAGLASCRKVGYRIMEGYALANLGYALAGQGKLDDALVSYGEAATIAERVQDSRLALAVRLYRTRADDQRGEDVRTLATKIAHEALAQELKALAAPAFALAARASIDAGDASGALELAEQAKRLRDDLGSLEEDEAEIFVTYADALEANGRSDEAKNVLAAAAIRLRELADKIQDVDWRRRFLEDVEMHRRVVAGAG